MPSGCPRCASGASSAVLAPSIAELFDQRCRPATSPTRPGWSLHQFARRQPWIGMRSSCVATVIPALAATTSSSPSRSRISDGACVDERAPALDDQLEHALEIGVAAHRQRDRLRGLQAAHGALELTAALLGVLVEAGVLDRDPRPASQHDDRVLIGLVELSALLLGQVEVAPRLAADQDRHTEERAHRRVSRGKAIGRGCSPTLG